VRFFAALLLAAALLLPALPAVAGVSCHCFRDRAFDPAEPARVDPYLLATARNGLLAGAAGLSKSDVVQARMTGAEEVALWIADRAGALTGKSADEIEAAREKAGSWQKALDALHLPAEAGPPGFAEARAEGSEEKMALALADEALRAAFGLDAAALARLRAVVGSDNGQAALAAFLARPGEPPETIAAEVLQGKRSFGALLTERGIAPDAVGDRIADAARKGLAAPAR